MATARRFVVCFWWAHEEADSAAAAPVLMALFVAALATMIITGLFYRQFVLLRTIENQQLTSQSRLLLRGALDWGRAILREDAIARSMTR